MKFTIRGEPKGMCDPRHRIVTPKDSRRKPFTMTYDPQGDFKESLRCIIQQKAPEKPFTGPVALGIVAYLKIPKSASQKTRNLMLKWEIRPTKKPDCTNIAKLYEDLLTGIVFLDDKQVVDLVVSKFYSDTPRVEIEVREITTV